MIEPKREYERSARIRMIGCRLRLAMWNVIITDEDTKYNYNIVMCDICTKTRERQVLWRTKTMSVFILAKNRNSSNRLSNTRNISSVNNHRPSNNNNKLFLLIRKFKHNVISLIKIKFNFSSPKMLIPDVVLCYSMTAM